MSNIYIRIILLSSLLCFSLVLLLITIVTFFQDPIIIENRVRTSNNIYNKSCEICGFKEATEVRDDKAKCDNDQVVRISTGYYDFFPEKDEWGDVNESQWVWVHQVDCDNDGYHWLDVN